MTHSIRGLVWLRVALGLFIALWGLDKIAATEGTLKIFSHFYKLSIGSEAAWVLGGLEILLGLAIAVGFKKNWSYALGFFFHLISTISSWKQLLDPWGWYLNPGQNSHLFLASLPVLAGFWVLWVNRNLDPGVVGAGDKER